MQCLEAMALKKVFTSRGPVAFEANSTQVAVCDKHFEGHGDQAILTVTLIPNSSIFRHHCGSALDWSR